MLHKRLKIKVLKRNIIKNKFQNKRNYSKRTLVNKYTIIMGKKEFLEKYAGQRQKCEVWSRVMGRR